VQEDPAERHEPVTEGVQTRERDIGRALRESYDRLGDDFRGFPAPFYHYRSDEEAAAYALGYMPRNIVKAQRVLSASRWVEGVADDLRILDLGVGPGTMSLAALGMLTRPSLRAAGRAVSFTMVDFSSAMLRLARQTITAQQEAIEQSGDCGIRVADFKGITYEIQKSGHYSFLNVFKLFGPGNQAPLSFPIPGWNVCVDFPIKPGLNEFLNELDRRAIDSEELLHHAVQG